MPGAQLTAADLPRPSVVQMLGEEWHAAEEGEEEQQLLPRENYRNCFRQESGKKPLSIVF